MPTHICALAYVRARVFEEVLSFTTEDQASWVFPDSKSYKNEKTKQTHSCR